MLSKRITAKSRELNPARHANVKTKKTIRLFQPPGLASADRISPLPPASAIFSVMSLGLSARHVLAVVQLDSSKLGQILAY